MQLYYVGSGLSFYFVYDFCVYNEMGPFLSYLLRYLPLLVAVVVSSAMLVLRRCLQKHAVPWHGLWWMVLLLYTHVLHTSVSILNCPALPGRDGANVPVRILILLCLSFNIHLHNLYVWEPAYYQVLITDLH